MFAQFDGHKSCSVSRFPLNYQFGVNVCVSLPHREKVTSFLQPLDICTISTMLTIITLKIADKDALRKAALTGVPLNGFRIELHFSAPLNPATVTAKVFQVKGGTGVVPLTILRPGAGQVVLVVDQKLSGLRQYRLEVSDALKGIKNEKFAPLSRAFYTVADPKPGALAITDDDDDLMTTVQQQTFKYFWDFAHPVSGMARERDTSGDTVTTGGSGFGLMCIIVGIERGFVTRQDALDRFDTILTFLEGADRFHGAWPHWMDGNTGKVIPFSDDDNGADLVETAYMIQGLLTFRQYLDPASDEEKPLVDRINKVWKEVEWDWFTQDGQDVLYWHWSPDKGWVMNMPIKGYNEALITYVLAASAPNHSINASVYHNGWAQNGAIKNGKSYYNITLPLGDDYGGPLYFVAYSFLGLDPRHLQDTYANYWEQNVNHSLINNSYCVDNPKGYTDYGNNLWGLTACDVIDGYTACSPTNDVGVVAPTGALSAFPYTPDQSMTALKHMYNKMADQLWSKYGFYDSCDPTEDWVSGTYIAIDEGPLVIMIENHRSALLWYLFMTSADVQDGLTKLGFTFV